MEEAAQILEIETFIPLLLQVSQFTILSFFPTLFYGIFHKYMFIYWAINLLVSLVGIDKCF